MREIAYNIHYFFWKVKQEFLDLIYSFWVTKHIKAQWAAFKFWQIKRLADTKKIATGRRHYVLRDWEGKLHAFNQTDIAKLKRLGIMSRKMTIYNLLDECLYWTK